MRTLVLLVLLAPWAAAHAEATPKLQKYGTRMTAPVGETVAFPDFQLRYLGRRGGSMGVVLFDHEIAGGSAKAIVSWGGTGDIAPQGFCFLGRHYDLERDYSDKLGRLTGDEIVVWRREKTPECRFRLTILARTWDELGLGQTFDEAWPRLRESALKDRPLQYIEADEIESYDASRQAITLNLHATQRLIGTLRAEAQSRNPSVTIPEDADPLRLLALKGFLIEAEGEPLYGGVFLEPESPKAVAYPRMTAEMVGGRAVLRVYSLPTNPSAGEKADPFKPLIADRRITALFRELGKLRGEAPKN